MQKQAGTRKTSNLATTNKVIAKITLFLESIPHFAL